MLLRHAAMGIHGDWGKIWKAEGTEFIDNKAHAGTVFVDGQILLMKSTVPEHGGSWQQYIDSNFTRRLVALHRQYETVILAFDNYEAVPLYKSIEQSRRVATAQGKRAYAFAAGDSIPGRPPSREVWAGALLNRVFKTSIISMIATVLARSYDPLLQRKVLILDFMNVVRIEFAPYSRTETVLHEMQAMGESDVKFMRYADKFGDLVVESVDSDVVLIAMLYTERTARRNKIYVKRIKSVSIDEDAGQKRKRVDSKKGKGLEYEVVCVNTLLQMLHSACREAVGPELLIDELHLTHILVCLMLLCGSDYSRSLPRVGAKVLWEMLDVVVPAFVAASHMGNASSLVVDSDYCTDAVFGEIYRSKFANHVRTHETTYAAVRADLLKSKLSCAVKESIPTRAQIECTLKNLSWVMSYWALDNTAPPMCEQGSHGFVVTDGLVRFADTVS